MTTQKKLGLLLLPLLPLTAIGIVEVADRVMPADTATQVAVQPTKSKPVKPNPPPGPKPAPQPPRPAPAK